MHKKIRLSAMLLLITLSLAAQSLTISGTVTDEAGESLVGVNIVVKGTGQGTVSDFEGKYRLPKIGRASCRERV